MVDSYNSFDTVGDIAITKLPDSSNETAKAIAREILDCNKGIKTVLAQSSKVSGDYRLRKLTYIDGEEKTRTTHKEHGCIFVVDVQTCYFSPRLSGERLRIAELVQPGETVVNMFAGVGCFSILIAEKEISARVFSIDINPEAFEFMQENIRLNRMIGRVLPLLGDAKEIVKTQLSGIADRVLMLLPEKAFEYLPSAVSALKTSGGWLHIHLFEHATKPESATVKASMRVADALRLQGVAFKFGAIRKVRSIGPHWSQIVVDVNVLPSVRSLSS